jgi:hypothetical protein
VAEASRPQAFTRFGFVFAASPGTFDARLVTTYVLRSAAELGANAVYCCSGAKPR